MLKTSNHFTIELGNPDDTDVAAVLKKLEEYSYSLYPPEGVFMLPISELKASHVHFYVARNHDQTILGCGALVLQNNQCAELKRMFVVPQARRKGIAAAILTKLEQVAYLHQVKTIRLETGSNQPEAIALYRRFGYNQCDVFGEYEDNPYSIFMEKIIS